MGWYTNVLTELDFCKETFNNEFQVDERIDENKAVINRVKDELQLMAVARPEDILINNKEADLFSIPGIVNNNIELLEEALYENFKLEILKENFNLRSGDFIKNPERRHNIKKWLLDNYILKPEDLNMNIKDIEEDEVL